MSRLSLVATPKAPPEPPKNPARVLQEGIGSVMKALNKPIDSLNERFAEFTAGLAQAWPEFPAATIGSLAMGLPHGHAPLPVLLPVLGGVALGCCVSVLINGKPAARVGDIGINPTCLGFPMPGFEIFTGSSKVFIGGARAARQFDVTMHCWPAPTKALKLGKLTKVASKVDSGVNKVMTVMPFVGMAAQGLGIVADELDAASAEDPAVAEAYVLSAEVGAKQLAMDAATMAFGLLLGKNTCFGPPVGAIMEGEANVLIGGFPVPSGVAMAQRQLSRAELSPSRRGENDANQQGPRAC
jgi:uncharacterized Zn-binding protein involved in type VI secretion